MNYRIIQLFLVVSITMLCGCLSAPRVLSQGTTSMLSPHVPRQTNSENSEQILGVQVAGHIPSEGMNIEQNYSIGGNLSYLYRAPNKLPLFAEVSAGGFYGQGEFSCQEDCDNSRLVVESWRALKNESFDYWSLQQRIRVGAEFNTDILLGGLALGAQFHENFGDMEDIRQDLVKSNAAEGSEESVGINFHMNLFLGFRIGNYGSILLEDGMIYAPELDSSNKIELFLHTISLTYFHQTGFFGGVSFAEDGISLNVGKTFLF